jgi:hypothetical protein
VESRARHLAGVRVETVRDEGPRLRVQAAAAQVEAACPGCGGASRRARSHYERRIRDQPVAGRRTVIQLTMRRFFYDASDCAKKAFAEEVTGLTARHARHSVPARQALTTIALAVGGRAGQRLTGRLALPTGRMTLLRAYPGTARAHRTDAEGAPPGILARAWRLAGPRRRRNSVPVWQRAR